MKRLPDVGEELDMGSGLIVRVVAMTVRRLSDVEVPRDQQDYRIVLDVHPISGTDQIISLQWVPEND